MSFTNIDTKALNKKAANQIQQNMKRIIHNDLFLKGKDISVNKNQLIKDTRLTERRTKIT